MQVTPLLCHGPCDLINQYRPTETPRPAVLETDGKRNHLRPQPSPPSSPLTALSLLLSRSSAYHRYSSLTIASVPAGFATARKAVRIASEGGDAKTAPGTAAVSIPLPTNPTCAGSCPLPPPHTSVTLPRAMTSSTSDLTTTLCGLLNSCREG